MTWWCSATGLPWSWSWQAYPGVWLFIALLGFSYWRFGRAPEDTQATRYFLSGLLVLWIALDWPLGTLGTYLASAHTGQFILITLGAPALLLLGLKPRLAALASADTFGARTLRFLARPAPAFVGYTVLMLGTHLPDIVDPFMATQWGTFLIDMLWLLAGLFLWWPVTAPEGFRRLAPPAAMGYLFVQTIPGTAPAAFLVFSQYPLYRLYELAPRVTEVLTPRYDHQVAGLLMKIVGDPVVWIGISVIFFRWANAERQADRTRTRTESAASRPG